MLISLPLPLCVFVCLLLVSDAPDQTVTKCMSDWCQRPVIHSEVGLCDLCYQRLLSCSQNEAFCNYSVVVFTCLIHAYFHFKLKSFDVATVSSLLYNVRIFTSPFCI